MLVRDKIVETIANKSRLEECLAPVPKNRSSPDLAFSEQTPLGPHCTVNSDGSLRPINILSFPHRGGMPSGNSFFDKSNFQTPWDHFDKVSIFSRSQTQPLLLAIFDWEKAYCQIPTAKSQWLYLMVQDFKNNILIDTQITFGGVAGCGSFGRPADAWEQIMWKEFGLVHIVEQLTELGVKTNPSKISVFMNEQKYISFIWNGAKRTVRLPAEKKFERVQQLKAFLEPEAVFTYNQVEVPAGPLNHVSSLLPQLCCYLNGIYLPLDAREDIESWFQTLLTFEEIRIIWSPNPTKIGWVGDASTGFGVGILIGHKWAQFQLTKEWRTGPGSDQDIGWLETVAVCLGILVLTKLGVLQGLYCLDQQHNHGEFDQEK
ncbi:hypothetical protein PSTG_00283 [Puccinia striiformis f. sp. tritici PST-78]|uniref:Reverse transcriptase domain-containing protein n=1 Tax=Puccinia striiformis f. sp. tritici PST-78 TaxID=1165861 RepID=A0A0L0W546_9BASI|nr:hypothetical protein PSTG_00283 [Puccinia striiformis f. sp. tritici PST-78]